MKYRRGIASLQPASLSSSNLVLAASFLLCLAAPVKYANALDPHTFKFAEFDATPMLKATQTFDDNYLDVENSEQDTWITRITPSIALSRSSELNKLQLNYQFSNVTFYDDSDDSYLDHKLDFIGAFDLGSRHRLNTQVGYSYGHEERGKGFSIGFGPLLTEPSTFEQTKIDSEYVYGSKQAIMNIGFKYQWLKMRWGSVYDNDLEPGILPESPGLDYTANREHDAHTIGSNIYYNLGAFTKATFNIAHTNVEYQNQRASEPTLDSSSFSMFAGFEWQGSALTTGYAKMGYSNKDFDAGNREDTSGLRWQVGVLWTPLTYSNFDFSTSREVSETKGQGSFIENTNYNLAWHHQWLNRLATKLSFTQSDDDYGDSIREDENTIISATAYYKMLRNVEFSASIINSERQSNVSVLEYQGNSFEVGLTLSF
ncbi:outer membrane beta-barrel protein [Thalassotalea crassostreae]|uniref:outer membrane beta-barrel protein n=1 Tax=Thalassotalea crassostreae TaxID=1763536 RepID=UPI0008384AE4|nr:outer membrane beta-barrel protein [Thalassotalea crassostreae]